MAPGDGDQMPEHFSANTLLSGFLSYTDIQQMSFTGSHTEYAIGLDHAISATHPAAVTGMQAVAEDYLRPGMRITLPLDFDNLRQIQSPASA